MTWHIQRIEKPTGIGPLPACGEGEEARKITLRNDATGETAVRIICATLNLSDPCDMLAFLQEDFSPNDWTVECGFGTTPERTESETEPNQTEPEWKQSSFDETGEPTPSH